MLLPITGLYAALLGLLIIVLVLRIVAKRFRQRIGVGDDQWRLDGDAHEAESQATGGVLPLLAT